MGIDGALEHPDEGKHAVMEQQEKETAPDGDEHDCKSRQISHVIPLSSDPISCPRPKRGGDLQAVPEYQPPKETPVAVVLIHW